MFSLSRCVAKRKSRQSRTQNREQRSDLSGLLSAEEEPVKLARMGPRGAEIPVVVTEDGTLDARAVTPDFDGDLLGHRWCGPAPRRAGGGPAGGPRGGRRTAGGSTGGPTRRPDLHRDELRRARGRVRVGAPGAPDHLPQDAEHRRGARTTRWRSREAAPGPTGRWSSGSSSAGGRRTWTRRRRRSSTSPATWWPTTSQSATSSSPSRGASGARARAAPGSARSVRGSSRPRRSTSSP